MAQFPRTRYASCGEADIAYQTLGDGPTDVLVLPGPSIPIDTIDADPSMYRFHRRLASFSRVIRLDQRGVGMSSRVSQDVIGPEFWAKDAISVMDAIGCERATILAPGLLDDRTRARGRLPGTRRQLNRHQRRRPHAARR